MLKAFISHSFSFSNSDFVDRLYKELSFYEIDITNQKYNDLYNEDVIESLLSFIKKSDVFIAVFDFDNTNVLLELGYAIGIGKQILITSSSEIDLPPHLRNYTFINSNLGSNDRVDEIIIHLEKIKKEKQAKTALIHTDIQKLDYNEIYGILNNICNDPNEIQNLDAHEFENIIFEWFNLNEFKPEWVKGEYGFDFVIYVGGNRLLVDVKKYSLNSYVSVMKVQQLLGAIHAYHADGGLIITTSGYTNSARDFARKCLPKLKLFDVKDLLIENIREYFMN